MSPRVAIVGFVSLLGAAVSLQADVAPFPSWRVVANGAIAQTVQAGDAIYLGGAFTKIGRGITPFDGVLDPATLTLTEESGCARSGSSALQPSELWGRYVAQPLDPLVDGAGPFPVVPNTALVRLGSDCRFDRGFRTILANVIVGRVVDAGASVFADMLYYTAFPITNENSVNVVVELNGQTGAMRRYWPGDLALVGLGPNGRLLASRAELNGNRVIGWFDQTSGDLVPGYTVPAPSPVVAVRGPVVVV